MKFADIPQFTRSGQWECDFDIVRAVKQIEEWEEEYDLQLNPDFQRGHVWTENQQISYLEFLFRGGKTARVIYFNHSGWMKSFEGDMVCVDGLQRITAIRRFVNNEIKVFGHYFKEYEDKPRMMCGVKFNINDLESREEVLQWYIEFNSGGTVHTQEEIDRVKKLLEEEKSKIID